LKIIRHFLPLIWCVSCGAAFEHAAGIAIGLLGAIGLTRLLASQLWRVSPGDPMTFAAVIVLLLVVGFGACLWPAHRAAHVDPAVALRFE